MCLKQQKQSSVVLKVCKIHEVLGTVNWEVIHWPELRCLFLMLHELLEAGGSRASSFPPWCRGTEPVSYRFINPRMQVKPFGCLWLWVRPWQCTMW